MEHADDIPTVLVSGTGPVGLTLALALHAHGVPVRIVGKAAGASEHSKALVIWARTLEDLAGVTDVEGFIDEGIVLQGARFHEGAEPIAELEMPK
ncbi:MAG: FAD-dependent monooxygenase, partial [Planctomycetota bacterium]|nr:FAD-dependent monooxygenase [Planctomycetota bacterium]